MGLWNLSYTCIRNCIGVAEKSPLLLFCFVPALLYGEARVAATGPLIASVMRSSVLMLLADSGTIKPSRCAGGRVLLRVRDHWRRGLEIITTALLVKETSNARETSSMQTCYGS